MEDLKKIFAFICCALWVFATIGGPAYLFYYSKPQFAIASLAVSAMAFPFIMDKAKEVINP